MTITSVLSSPSSPPPSSSSFDEDPTFASRVASSGTGTVVDSVGAVDAVEVEVGLEVEGGTVGVDVVGPGVGLALATGDSVGGSVSPTSEISHVSVSTPAARQQMTPSLCRTSSPPPQLSHRNTRGLPRPPDGALEQNSTLDPPSITEASSVPQVTVRSERSPAKLSVAMAEMTLPSTFLCEKDVQWCQTKRGRHANVCEKLSVATHRNSG